MSDQNDNEKEKSERPKSEEDIFFSRRHFLKKALVGAAGGGLFLGSLSPCGAELNTAKQPPLINGPSKLKSPPQQAIGFISRVSVKESACASCGLCSLVCASVHGDTIGPTRAGIWLERKPFECEYISITCQQCDEPECLNACEEEALYIESKTGARVIDSKKCVGCKECIEACVYEEPRIQWDEELGIAFKCDLCSGRPEGPACVEFCPRRALILAREIKI